MLCYSEVSLLTRIHRHDATDDELKTRRRKRGEDATFINKLRLGAKVSFPHYYLSRPHHHLQDLNREKSGVKDDGLDR